MSKNAKLFSLLSLFTLIIFACTLPAKQGNNNDSNIIFTAAAQTASVQLTQVSLSGIATQTPLPVIPSFTPPASINATPEGNCDKAKFVTDVSVPDGTILDPNETFIKTWRIRNIGTCTWTTGYALVYEQGAQMGGISPQPLSGNVAPGETVDISINLTSPAATGKYTGNWQIRNATNILFAKMYVQIKVVDGKFAVISVGDMDAYYISGRGAALIAKITTNKAGKVKYHWILREAGQADITTSIEVAQFSSGSSEEVSTLWSSCPHTGNFTAYLYIDEPNHQEFGQTNFKCP